MNNNYENLPAVLNANQLAAALGISRAERISSLTRGRSPRCVSASGCLCRRISSSTGSSRTREAGMATEKKRLPRFHLLHQMGSSRPRLHAQTV